MEERERQRVYIIKDKDSASDGFVWLIDIGQTGAAYYRATHNAIEKYVDTLTDKQREALTFIRMLPEREYVEGIGAWVKLSDPARKVYIIDC